jgi:hypothetical protein
MKANEWLIGSWDKTIRDKVETRVGYVHCGRLSRSASRAWNSRNANLLHFLKIGKLALFQINSFF